MSLLFEILILLILYHLKQIESGNPKLAAFVSQRCHCRKGLASSVLEGCCT